MVVMLRQCCCGCSLKTGSLIIAAVFIITGGLELVLFTYLTRTVYEHLEYLEALENEGDEETGVDTSEATPGNHTSSSYDDESERLVRMTLIRAIMFMSIVRVVLSVFEISVNIVLILGANKNSVRLLLVWVIGFPCWVICSTIVYLAEMGIMLYCEVVDIGIAALILSTISAAAAVYCWLVVFSLYRQLRSTAVARRLSQQQDDH